MNFKKNSIRNLLWLGLIVYIICLVIANIFNIETKNNWYAALTIFLTSTPILYAGILYSNKIKLLKPKLFIALRLLIIFFIITYVSVFCQELIIVTRLFNIKEIPENISRVAFEIVFTIILLLVFKLFKIKNNRIRYLLVGALLLNIVFDILGIVLDLSSRFFWLSKMVCGIPIFVAGFLYSNSIKLTKPKLSFYMKLFMIIYILLFSLGIVLSII